MMIVVSIAGCAYVDPGYPDRTVIDPAVQINKTQSNYYMNGTIQIEGALSGKEEFRNVMVCFYSEEKTIIQKTQIGDMDTKKGYMNVSVSIERVPEYIIVNSSDFWEVSGMQVNYLADKEINNQKIVYRVKHSTNPKEFPVQCPANASG